MMSGPTDPTSAKGGSRPSKANLFISPNKMLLQGMWPEHVRNKLQTEEKHHSFMKVSLYRWDSRYDLEKVLSMLGENAANTLPLHTKK